MTSCRANGWPWQTIPYPPAWVGPPSALFPGSFCGLAVRSEHTGRKADWRWPAKRGGNDLADFPSLLSSLLLCTDFSLVYAWGSLANHNVMILKEIFLCWYDWFDIMFFWDHGKNVVWVSCDLQCTRTVHVILDVVYNHRKYIYISFMHFFLLFFTKQNIYILSKNINLYFEQKKKTLL